MIEDLTAGIFDVALRARIMREWQKAHAARNPEFSEREMLVLEIVSDFGPVTERELRKVFDIFPSQASELISRLSITGLLRKGKDEADGRVKPLSLTREGEEQIEAMKRVSAQRYEYLFSSLTEEEQEQIVPVLSKISHEAEKMVRQMVFGEFV